MKQQGKVGLASYLLATKVVKKLSTLQSLSVTSLVDDELADGPNHFTYSHFSTLEAIQTSQPGIRGDGQDPGEYLILQ